MFHSNHSFMHSSINFNSFISNSYALLWRCWISFYVPYAYRHHHILLIRTFPLSLFLSDPRSSSPKHWTISLWTLNPSVDIAFDFNVVVVNIASEFLSPFLLRFSKIFSLWHSDEKLKQKKNSLQYGNKSIKIMLM